MRLKPESKYAELLLWIDFTRIYTGLIVIYEKDNPTCEKQMHMNKRQVPGANCLQGFADLANLYAADSGSL